MAECNLSFSLGRKQDSWSNRQREFNYAVAILVFWTVLQFLVSVQVNFHVSLKQMHMQTHKHSDIDYIYIYSHLCVLCFYTMINVCIQYCIP